MKRKVSLATFMKDGIHRMKFNKAHNHGKIQF